MIAFKIDELTPCLTDALTGETFQTEVVELKRKSFLSKFNPETGWYVDWGAFPVVVRVFALVLKGTMDIQGLIAVSPNASKDTRALHIHWACTAPHNNIWEYGVQKYKGVGGHLFAIAADLSFQYGFDGYVYGEAMDEDILNYYIRNFGAQPLPRSIHPFALMINGDNMKRLWRCTIMYGQMKPSSKHQEIVNKYIEENNPYIAHEPLRFDLRAYDAYMHEHGITDPDQIPEEVLSLFTGKPSDNQECAV